MLEFWAVGLPILLVDVANPVLLAMVLLALATDRPFLNSIMLILGHTLAYFLAGVAIDAVPLGIFAKNFMCTLDRALEIVNKDNLSNLKIYVEMQHEPKPSNSRKSETTSAT